MTYLEAKGKIPFRSKEGNFSKGAKSSFRRHVNCSIRLLLTCVMADRSKKEPTPPPLLLMPAGGGLTLNPPDQPQFLMPVIQSESPLLGKVFFFSSSVPVTV